MLKCSRPPARHSSSIPPPNWCNWLTNAPGRFTCRTPTRRGSANPSHRPGFLSRVYTRPPPRLSMSPDVQPATTSLGSIADRTRHRIAARLLPFLFVLYITNYLDRTNLAYAALEMSRDLHFSDRVFGLGAGIF